MFDKFLAVAQEQISQYALSFTAAIAILIIGFWLVKRLTASLQKILDNSKLDKTVVTFSINALRIVLTVLVVITCLNNLGVSTASILAVLGTAGVAVALALKDSLRQVASGIILLILRPFEVGQYIESGSIGGTVVEINLFHTRLNTLDNKIISVPNALLLDKEIVNFSANTQRRIDLVVGISYRADIDKAKALVQEILEQDLRILTEPEPMVALWALADNSVNLAVRPWVRTEEFLAVRSELLEKIKLAFDANGIGIPYPQRDVYLYDMSKTGVETLN